MILQMQSHVVLSAEGLHFSALFINTLFEDAHITQLVDYLYTKYNNCLLYTSPSPRDATLSRMPSSA